MTMDLPAGTFLRVKFPALSVLEKATITESDFLRIETTEFVKFFFSVVSVTEPLMVIFCERAHRETQLYNSRKRVIFRIAGWLRVYLIRNFLLTVKKDFSNQIL